MGHAGWKRLHRLAYVAPALGVVHFVWRVKTDVSEPVAYGLVLAALVLVRLATYLRPRLSAEPS
jgi:sulfoxide reductase heme-binding subunit YedZ